MTEKELFDAIHACDDKYLEEVIEEESSKAGRGSRIFGRGERRASGLRIAAAAIVCILILGTGVSVLATSSDRFHTWLLQTFAGHEVTEITYDSEWMEKDREPDIKADADQRVALKDTMNIYGERESFVCESHEEGDDEIVDKVYAIQENGLKQIPIKAFRGEYDGVEFSFEYAVIQNEICGFNYKGDIGGVFHYKNGDIVYADLFHVADNDIIEKECIVSLNLETGEVIKLSGDDMICNFVMSPGGKLILCNHRSDGYWTVFDIATGKEKKVKGIDGYAHTDEIRFLDDYHILTLGKPFMKGDTEWYSTYSIDLRTQKILEEYMDNGEIQMEWAYTLDDSGLKLYNITNEKSFVLEDVTALVQPMDDKGDYVLFGNPEEENAPFYLVNLAEQSFMKIELPQTLQGEVEMHLAVGEKKLLLVSEQDAFLVDISKLHERKE